jgi:hypothetical protein
MYRYTKIGRPLSGPWLKAWLTQNYNQTFAQHIKWSNPSHKGELHMHTIKNKDLDTVKAACAALSVACSIVTHADPWNIFPATHTVVIKCCKNKFGSILYKVVYWGWNERAPGYQCDQIFHVATRHLAKVAINADCMKWEIRVCLMCVMLCQYLSCAVMTKCRLWPTILKTCYGQQSRWITKI